MTLRQVLPIHGSSHRPQGADPIPGFEGYIHWGENTDDDELGLDLTTTAPFDWDAGSIFIDSADDISITSQAGGMLLTDNGGGIQITENGGGGIIINSNGGGDIVIEEDDDIRITAVGGEITIAAGTLVSIAIGSGQTFTIKDSGGNPMFQMTDGSPDVHIPTGGSVIADL